MWQISHLSCALKINQPIHFTSGNWDFWSWENDRNDDYSRTVMLRGRVIPKTNHLDVQLSITLMTIHFWNQIYVCISTKKHYWFCAISPCCPLWIRCNKMWINHLMDIQIFLQIFYLPNSDPEQNLDNNKTSLQTSWTVFIFQLVGSIMNTVTLHAVRIE